MRLILTFFVLLISINLHAAPKSGAASDDIVNYIASGWNNLLRSMTECMAFYDPKMHNNSIVYLPIDLPMPISLKLLTSKCHLTIKRLPHKITQLGDDTLDKIYPSGLLYLPHPYVVPGGMFNEMYGWDSYFIVRGLLEDKQLPLAENIIENFFFEIDHYGGTLNGNRTYYLSRTQIPFLTLMIRAVFEYQLAHGNNNITWLQKAYDYAVKDYALWQRPEHLAGNTGLSRYYDYGYGAVTELYGPSKTYYLEVVHYFLSHPDLGKEYLLYHLDSPKNSLGPVFNITVCNKDEIGSKTKDCKQVEHITLSRYFYAGDRAMRESGFDISFRYGPFSSKTLDYAPIDLNSLLYAAEKNLAWMSHLLHHEKDEQHWQQLAVIRQTRINQYLWNEQQGLYFDYNFVTEKQSALPYAVTFYPLWVGLVSEEQAKRLVSNVNLFEKPGGLVTSLQHTGVQWDAPYGWAPLQLIAAEGLFNNGEIEIASRISKKFISMVYSNFAREHTIREKYNVVARSSLTDIQVGYKTNVVGFGWTNGVYLVLLHKLNSLK